jgi:hypothetical protein
MKGKSCLLACLLGALVCCSGGDESHSETLLEERFEELELGMFSEPVGPHTEYHYLPEAAPKGNWAVSCFSWEKEAQRAWHVKEEGGTRVMVQTFDNKEMLHTHPMIVTGNEFWKDYTVTVEFAPESARAQSGVAFRYRNDRCYYFLGLDKERAVLKLVRHATGFRQPSELVLAEKLVSWDPGEYYTAKIEVRGERIKAEVGDLASFQVTEPTFPRGRIALTADVPTRYRNVRVRTSEAARIGSEQLYSAKLQEEEQLQAQNPRPLVWRKIGTKGFGAGRNLRFGDLDGDGQIDVLIGQVIHHGAPRDNYSELSCLTAMNFEGDILWQLGEPDPEKWHLTNDVGFQIHDIDNDGSSEVVYTKGFELIVAEGSTGRTKYKVKTPRSEAPADEYPRILGDCLYFCDLRGTGHDRDVIIKDRYWHLWALSDRLEPLWEGECRTGHYPYAFDVDEDGRDELVIGYTLFDDDGQKLWSLDESVEDHADGVAVVDFKRVEDSVPVIFVAASDAGVFYADLQGTIIKHHWIGHGQNPAVADFRPDLPGLEAVSINFWGNQGIIHFYDSSGNIYYDFEPNQYGSMCLPINWTGKPGEFFVHSPNIKEGGMYDGWGRRVVMFPDDGHPDMCNAVMDITGDCRDEVVVWDPEEIWVYTQDDNPKDGRLYRPERNPLYNYSNYQATVSLPGWSE